MYNIEESIMEVRTERKETDIVFWVFSSTHAHTTTTTTEKEREWNAPEG